MTENEELKVYFSGTQGTGILSTADGDGVVNNAIYARPHFLEDGSVAFIMRERLTHHNLQSNDHAAYLFIEKSGNYRGRRLHLTRVSESTDLRIIDSLKRRSYADDNEVNHYFVRFRIDRIMPLLGPGGESITESQTG